MQKKQYEFSYEVYEDASELDKADAQLIEQARNATQNAYAPYSHFRVGAAAYLDNGLIVTGVNQENASYPAGICAERTLMATASNLYPGVAIRSLAVSYHNENGPSDHPISPCGICRQSIQEFEQRTGKPMRLLLSGMEGKVYVIAAGNLLLPFAFTSDELK